MGTHGSPTSVGHLKSLSADDRVSRRGDRDASSSRATFRGGLERERIYKERGGRQYVKIGAYWFKKRASETRPASRLPLATGSASPSESSFDAEDGTNRAGGRYSHPLLLPPMVKSGLASNLAPQHHAIE
jgi:hypothetical protein